MEIGSGIIIIGAISILAYFSRNNEDEYLRGFFSLSSLALLIGALNVVRTAAIADVMASDVINSIWVVQLSFMLIFLCSIFYTVYKLIKSIIDKYKRIANGEDLNDED